MSGVAIVQYLLSHNAGLQAKVAASSIFPGVVPLGTPLPAVVVKEVSATTRNTVAMNDPTVLVTERVQVAVQAKSYKDKKTILDLVRAALPLSRGTVNGFICDSIIDDVTGPDLDDPGMEIFEQSQDFMVRFSR